MIIEILGKVRRRLQRMPRKRSMPLLLAYIGLRFKEATARSTKKRNRVQANLVGFKVRGFNYSALRFLFDEIFLGNEYYFTPSNNQPLIIDLGSNIGISVLFFKWLYPAARIIAFEADAQTFEVLRENVQINQLTDIQLHNLAIYDSDGNIDLYYNASEPGSTWTSTQKERLPGGSREVVPSALLSNYIDEEIDFVKMDIEGAEIRVLREMAEHGKLCKIKELVVEYHHHMVPENDKLSELFVILEKNGFGYQVSSFQKRPFNKQKFQDILVYAYRK